MKALERYNIFLKQSHSDLDLGPKTLKFKVIQDIVILHICMVRLKSIHKVFFSKNCHCDLDLDPITLKRKIIRGIVISNTCVKLYRNWIIDEVARVMTIGEYTNVRTYRTDPISPPQLRCARG